MRRARQSGVRASASGSVAERRRARRPVAARQGAPGLPARSAAPGDIPAGAWDAEEWTRRLQAECAARVRAEEACAARDRFLALVSHEMRNPLSAIVAGVSALRSHSGDSPRLAQLVDILHRNVNVQVRLVDDLLDLSRAMCGKMQLRRSLLLLDRAVAAAAGDFGQEAQHAGLRLTHESQPALWVYGDEDRLHQVLANLLGNAIKFTPAGGAIHLACYSPGEAEAHIAVEDTGIGLDVADTGQLFEMFAQGDAGRRHHGLGIGLALVKCLVELHGGRVWAESAGAGLGSRFVVSLPLAAPAGESAAGIFPTSED